MKERDEGMDECDDKFWKKMEKMCSVFCVFSSLDDLLPVRGCGAEQGLMGQGYCVCLFMCVFVCLFMCVYVRAH